MPLFLLFILVPLIEIYLLIKVGSVIGAFSTILIVMLTAIIGTWLLRQQGMATLMRFQTRAAQGRMPAQEMAEGLALAFGGALLLTPGFVTDIIGFLCLIPFTRQGIIRWLMRRMKLKVMSGMSPMDAEVEVRETRSGRTIEGDFVVKDKDRDPWLDD
ncbi:MAG: hypothetical protein DSZ28_03285 [Thiothrix sp.]|nr:MAG: hypothetical protein DSZ28_03285 [Thiothrix sp.]